MEDSTVDVREESTQDDEDVVELLDEHEALEFAEFDPTLQPKDTWPAPEAMAAFLNKHFNRSLTGEEREAIMHDFPKPDCDALIAPRIDKEVKDQLKEKGKDAHWGAEKPLYKIQEQLLDVSGPLTCLWADLTNKKASFSAEDILLTVQRTLVLLGSASNAISLERRRIAWARLNPKLKALASEDYEKRETNLFGPSFMEKATKRVEANKALEKVAGASFRKRAPPSKKPQMQEKNQEDLRSFVSKGVSAHYGGRQNLPAPTAVCFYQVQFQAPRLQPHLPGECNIQEERQFPIGPPVVSSSVSRVVTCMDLNFKEVSLQLTPRAGQIQHCAHNWLQITKVPWILEVVKGYRLELEYVPVQHKPAPPLIM